MQFLKGKVLRSAARAPAFVCRVLAVITLIASAATVFSQRANAKDLSGFIANLYGGQGLAIAGPGCDPRNPAPGCEPHFFQLTSQGLLNGLNSSIGGTIPATSFNAIVVGATYDVVQGLPVRNVESLGPLVAERAETLGPGILNIGMSFGQAKFTRFNGTRLDQLTLQPSCGPGCVPEDVTNDLISVNLRLSIEKDVVGFYATYGLTPRWDIGVVVPVVRVKAQASSDAMFTDVDNDLEGFAGTAGTITADRLHATSESGGTATGIGDIIVRSKYNFIRDAPSLPDFSLVGQVQVPTGDQANLLGSGSTDVMGLAVLSKQIGRLAPHVNLGYEVASGGIDRNNFRYAAGVDASLSPEITLAVDVVGRAQSGGPNLSDLALGFKWGFSEQGLLSAGIIVPINRDTGLRPDFAWTAGLEVNF